MRVQGLKRIFSPAVVSDVKSWAGASQSQLEDVDVTENPADGVKSVVKRRGRGGSTHQKLGDNVPGCSSKLAVGT